MGIIQQALQRDFQLGVLRSIPMMDIDDLIHRRGRYHRPIEVLLFPVS